MYYFMISFCIIFVSFTQSFNIDDVSNYEVVSIRHKRQANNGLTIEMMTRGEQIKFYLNPTDGFIAGTNTKVYTAKNENDHVQFSYQEEVMNQLVMNFYQDPDTFSSIAQSVDTSGRFTFTGNINNTHILRPLPDHLGKRRDLLKINSSFFENNAKGFINTDEHIIYKQTFDNSIPFSTPKVFNDKLMKTKSVSRRDVYWTPSIVYPEILVYVDELIFAKFNYDMMKAVEYTLSYWNGVDLRFRQFQKPMIRLYISGIVLFENTPPFVYPTLYSNEMCDAEVLRQEFASFLHKDNIIQPIKDYDISMYMTARKLYTINENREATGIANLGSPCFDSYDQSDYNNGKYYSSGIVIDDNDYKYLLTAAHELGHILGAPHDEEQPEDGAPYGSINCLKEESYIMSYNNNNRNMFFFSPCSEQNIIYTLSQESSSCLRNNPAEYENNYPLRRLLPGEMMSLDEQCQKMGFLQCAYDKTTCLDLYCYMYNDEGIMSYYTYNEPPAEGSYCGDGMYCIAGQCEYKV
ncbi:A disintegrin and metalloproteinase with thrombospondin motifs 16-like [Leptopilina boulardi]|uniref:A disintegrin and metalloproteinase with thrombospondin motifs 16-like n=1 Tax=Leptopilina boulardi TaxID=63433 RepID=UPI0021F5F5B5|nr:A disintegrin and metalloproteinase with thrombospondin motifs 16-like [Leptopilina boulardi]